MPLVHLTLMAAVGVVFPSQAADPVTLRDHAIASSEPPTYLDGAWTAVNVGGASAAAGPLAATVPGDILTDLQNAKRAPDPYWNTTWREPQFVATWCARALLRAGVRLPHDEQLLPPRSACSWGGTPRGGWTPGTHARIWGCNWRRTTARGFLKRAQRRLGRQLGRSAD